MDAGNVHAMAERVSVEDLGAGSFIEELDEELQGLEPGAIQGSLAADSLRRRHG